jgi:NAD(P)H-nitrite reductase large subunit
MNDYTYVIVGNSAGGLAAAREIRRTDGSGSMLMISEEPYAAYSRPLIAKHVSEGKGIEAMQLATRESYESQGIELRLSTRAARIDASAKLIEMENGEAVSWQRLLLATGGAPVVPPIPGRERTGVHTFTTFGDAKALAARLSDVRHAVIVGGGFIGLSAADALRTRGIGVTVVEMQPRLLSAMLDMAASYLAEEAATTAGVRVLTGRRVVSINGDHPQSTAVSSVTIDDGTRVQCEMVILAVGVRPRTEVATGVATIDRGILVDESMQTSAPDIFACGDACQTYDFARDREAVLAVWPNAVAGGAVAGASMAGHLRKYEGGTTLNALPYFGLSVGSAGIVDHDPTLHEIVVASGRGYYRKVVLQDSVIVGMVFAGDTSKCGLIYNLMKRRVKIGEWRDGITAQ